MIHTCKYIHCIRINIMYVRAKPGTARRPSRGAWRAPAVRVYIYIYIYIYTLPMRDAASSRLAPAFPACSRSTGTLVPGESELSP